MSQDFMLAITLITVAGAALCLWLLYRKDQIFIGPRPEKKARPEPREAETAYLVGKLDLSSSPPRVTAINVFSARASHLTIIGPEFSFDIVSCEGDSYRKAKDNLGSMIRAFHLMFGWTVPLMTAGTRHALGFDDEKTVDVCSFDVDEESPPGAA